MYIVVVYCIVMLMLQIDLVVVPALSSAQTTGIACSTAARRTCSCSRNNLLFMWRFCMLAEEEGRRGGEEGRIGQTGMDIFSLTLLVIGQLKQKRTRLR